MILAPLWQALHDSAIGTVVRENGLVFPWLEAIHVMAISTVVGTIAIIDLRLLGLASTSYAVSRLTRSLLPLTWAAFAIALLTGALMFSSQPETYLSNLAFRLKMAMLLAAGMNMATFHLLTARGQTLWDREAPVPRAGRIAGLLSMLIWVTIVALGRWIGFTTAPF